jgi:hypothetical protein
MRFKIMQTNRLGRKINNMWKNTRWKLGGEDEFTRKTIHRKISCFPRAWRCVESQGPGSRGI